MIANVSAHRRANAFAQALEEASAADQETPETGPAEQAETGRLLTLAGGLGELPKPEMDPQVKVEQRTLLMAEMERMFAGGAAADPQVPEQRTGRGAHRATSLRKLRPRSRWSKGIAAGGLSIGVAAGAFSGVAAASSDALPGDSLYGLKRGMEDLKLTMADDDASRGVLYLDQASTRLSEARRLMERGRAGDLDHEQLGEVRRALSGMEHDASEAHRLLHQAYARDGSLEPIAALNSFSEAHRESWSKLRGKLPPQLTDVGNQVSSVFAAIDQEVKPLQSLLPKTSSKTHTRQGTSHPGGTSGATRPSAPSSSTGSGHTTPGQSGKPQQPSGSGSPSGEGLLGGNTGGLFEPGTGSATPAPPAKPPKPPVPDVTLPPLLPGLLPDLNIHPENPE
ncbi:hypothetical protein DWB77_03417 [Streptomyces hundungensis]|uniref:DUF5667 domain-containing protein n=1 Tax=Streptomyces hundungensis TaxID=1077946 RepID=A0A387HBP4_9ACTN|nr:DUF5667 domain-containing protein [Streptomyces hundungensis]AYG81275.1 hypothetical protein DWB77_03417 [Streptomyces hundungensis]